MIDETHKKPHFIRRRFIILPLCKCEQVLIYNHTSESQCTRYIGSILYYYTTIYYAHIERITKVNNIWFHFRDCSKIMILNGLLTIRFISIRLHAVMVVFDIWNSKIIKKNNQNITGIVHFSYVSRTVIFLK